jgi:hypothetical protein
MHGGDFDPVPTIRELFAVWDYGDVSNKTFQVQLEQVLGRELPDGAVRYLAKHGQTKTASLTGLLRELHIRGAVPLDAYTAQREPPPSQQLVPDDYRPTTAEEANRITWSRAGGRDTADTIRPVVSRSDFNLSSGVASALERHADDPTFSPHRRHYRNENSMGDIIGSAADASDYRKMKKTTAHATQGHGDIIKWSAPNDERVRYSEIEETCLSQRRHFGNQSDQARATLAHLPSRQRDSDTRVGSSSQSKWENSPYMGLR